MLKLLILVVLGAVADGSHNYNNNYNRNSNINTPTDDQLGEFKKNLKGQPGIMTTSSGAPIEQREAVTTLNSELLHHEFFVDSITHIVRERIPERVLHAKGSGAYGYFETTHDITHVCKAKLFSKIGKKTPVAVRFSPGFVSLGGIDTGRETRGFAVKFYTEEGNFDFTGVNAPMFAIKDPLLFSPIVHSVKRNPATNLHDSNMLWDFGTLHPEIIYTLMFFFSDRSIPRGYRHMSGHAIHTFQLQNENGDINFWRMHFYPVNGVKSYNATEATRIAGADPDYFTRDLYNAIATGNFPTWEFKVQILSPEDVKNANYDVFDSTIELPESDFPLHKVGTLCLNKNPTNYFAEFEPIAFCPGNVVPGIAGSPDKLYEGRRFAYRDAQNYRLGPNFNKYPVNCPLHARTYNRDGVSPVNDNGKDGPNYYPNSFGGPNYYVDKKRPSLVKIYEKQPNNFKEAGKFYSSLTTHERNNLVDNIVISICPCQKIVKERTIKFLTIIHPELGKRVGKSVVNCKNKSIEANV